MPQKEYQIISGLVVVILILLLAGMFIVTLVAFNNRRKKRYMDEKRTMESNFQQEILRTQLEIQEQTLKNISQEIHDNIGQVLSLAKLNLATIDVSKALRLQEKIDESKNLIGKVIQDLRDLAKSLNTDYVVQLGLARSIEYELELINKTDIFKTSFKISGSVLKLEKQNELVIFRIVQETLNNIIKHSGATEITVLLDYKPEMFQLSIKDNGQGFNLEDLSEKNKYPSGLGIRNMQNRAELIHAQFEISTDSGMGTCTSLKLPLKS
jgi:two-component system, NarL family, sensor kinase